MEVLLEIKEICVINMRWSSDRKDVKVTEHVIPWSYTLPEKKDQSAAQEISFASFYGNRRFIICPPEPATEPYTERDEFIVLKCFSCI
jgi:hypothetical protein